MGREWYWSRPMARGERESPGCMSGMLNFFDFHQLLFTTNSSSSDIRAPPDSQEHHPSPKHKGLEAPRNSLELDEVATSTSSAGDGYFHVPLGIQLLLPVAESKKSSKMSSLLEEERRSLQSGTPRTPSVVARLMGLDVLPDLASSPPVLGQRSPTRSPCTPPIETRERYQKKKMKKGADECRRGSPPRHQPLQPLNCNTLTQVRLETGTRSLPDTPRVSSARSWDSDPRLSLQINKENNNRGMHEFNYLCEVSAVPPSTSPNLIKTRKKDCSSHRDENKSPRSHHYAREIVKQVKDSISSRKGGGGGCSGDEQAVGARRARPAAEKKASGYDESWNQSKPSEVKQLLSCYPPRIPFMEPPTNRSSLAEDTTPNPPPKPLQPLPKGKGRVEAKAVKMASSNCKKASYERYMEKIKKKTSPPETVTVTENQLSLSDKKRCTHIPSLVAVQLNGASHPLPWPLPDQIRKSLSIPAQEQEQAEGALKPLSTGKSHRRRQPKERDPEFRYVRSILEHAEIMASSVHSVIRWYSPSLPIDPIIFYQLELELRLSNEVVDGHHWTTKEEGELLLGPLRHPWNRKLLFHLVEEVLGDLLSTTTNLVGDDARWRGGGESLLLRLWSQIRRFPSADCRVIGDIDALVEGDLPEAKVRGLLQHPSVVGEAEHIALEIERNIFDSILGEAAASLALLQGSSTGGRR